MNKANIIKKPFRFLKNVMRWYEKEGDNIVKEIRRAFILPSLWKKAEDNFNKRGLPIPIYENHNESEVVGEVDKIEAREDGLYVVEHRLFEKGKYLIESKEYPLPSGDFVVHYNDDGNIEDIEVFGVSLVNNEGAKDVEPVTMNKIKSDIGYSLNKVIKAGNGDNNKNKIKGVNRMDKEELFEILNDDEFVKTIPQDLVDKIIALRKETVLQNKDEVEKATATEDEEVSQSKEGEETKVDEEAVDTKQCKKKARMSKDEALIKAIEELLNGAGVSEEVITAIKDLLPSEEVSQNKDADEEVEDEEVSQSKEGEDDEDDTEDEERLDDMIARHEAETGAKVVPSTVKQAKKVLHKTKALMGKRAYKIAFNELSFIGGRKIEKVSMSKVKDRSLGDVVRDIMKI